MSAQTANGATGAEIAVGTAVRYTGRGLNLYRSLRKGTPTWTKLNHLAYLFIFSASP